MDELPHAIAQLFRRKGRGEMTEKEFVLAASMDLRWFPPKDAQKLVQRGLDEGLLVSRDGTLRPTFDFVAIELVRDFHPTPAILMSPRSTEDDLFLRMMDAVSDRTGSDRRNTIAQINSIQERLDVNLEVAALIAAYKAGVDVAAFLEKVEAKLRTA